MAFQRRSFMYGVIVGSVTYGIIKWYYERRTRKRTSLSKEGQITFYGEDDCLLFIPTSNVHCSLIKGYCCGMYGCSCNYRKFLALIECTKFSLDVCVYMITSDEIAQMLFRLLRRGVYVRIVMDKHMSQSTKSKLVFFMENHIPLKLIEGKDGQLMHNKFVIIDQLKLITGSFNWTESGFKKNFESGIVTHNKIILLKYRAYYEFIWNSEGKFSVEF